MSGLDDLPPLRETIRKYGLGANKALGQNFLLDLNLTGRIARTAGDLTGCEVVEVGPGPGGLTRALLTAGAKRVVVIERDRRFIPALQEIAECCPGRLAIVEADALTADYPGIVGQPAKVVANLPYNIATPLFVGWLRAGRSGQWWQSLTLLFQKEVAERIVAEPGSPNYGRLSVISAVYTEPRIAFDISPRAFTPPPKVTSSLVQVAPRPQADYALMEALETVTRAAFGQRRKMLRSSLKAAFAEPEAVLRRLQLDPARRAETLSIAQFLALAQAYYERAG